MGAFGERCYSPAEMIALHQAAGFCDVSVTKCPFAHIHLVHPLYAKGRRIEPFVVERIPSLADHTHCQR
ncbi:MAG: hypothetical protein A4E37_01082 [Methanoregulaceae archaeon PtaB.Bin056]|nr:MAG: hypothetical protein A4E37_01082 [Methanoregulaceae archaeon PtaB.Bin056]